MFEHITVDDALRILDRMNGGERLVGDLMVTTGASLASLLAARVADVAPMEQALTLAESGRVKVLPDLREDIRFQLDHVRQLYEDDVRRLGLSGWDRLQPGWRWRDMPLFADDRWAFRRGMGQGLRPALPATRFVEALANAARACGCPAQVHSHTLRHVHACWRLALGESVESLGHRLGHRDMMTTLLYAESLSRGGLMFTKAA